jgi:hypothetical protein
MITTDCRTSCAWFNTFSNNTIYAGNRVADVLVSNNFELQFDVVVGALADAGTYRNMVEIRDRATFSPLVRVGITDSPAIRVSHNNFAYFSNGPRISDDYTGTYATVKVTVMDGYISAWSSAQPLRVDTAALTEGLVNTTNNVYIIYTSAPDINHVSSSGYVRNLILRGKIPSFSLDFAVLY